MTSLRSSVLLRVLPHGLAALGLSLLLPGCNSGSPGTTSQGPVRIEGPVTVQGGVEVSNPVRVAGPVEVTGTLEGLKGSVQVQGPVEMTGRLQGIDSPVTVQGTVGVSGPVQVQVGAQPLRVMTADTDPSRFVSGLFGGGWGSSFRGIQTGPLVLTSVSLYPFSGGFSGSESARLFSVPGSLVDSDCSAVDASSRSYLMYLQYNVLTAITGVRLVVPEGHTLCVSGANPLLYSGFRPY